MSWLDEVIDQHRELESPITFVYWAAMAALSACVKDNVYLERGYGRADPSLSFYKLYPNIYVMLHARSGLKKGPPISMAKRIVRAVNNTRIISGRSSIQGILKELGTAYTQPGGIVMNKAIGFICSSELSSSLVDDKATMDILTDLYDRIYNEGEWKSLLKSETFNLKDPTITMLTATNEAHADEFFAKKDVQGGFFARTFIIYADKENIVNSLIDPLENPPDYKKLSEYAKEVAKLQGPFEKLYNTPAGNLYKDWYMEFAKHRKDVEDDTGTINRFGDSVLKVAMLLSLTKAPILKISLDAMEEAIVQCEKLIGHTRRVTMGKKGRSSYANQKVMILEKLLERDNHMITRAKLMEEMHYHLNSSELDEIMTGFQQSGQIKSESHGNQLVYIMPEVVVNQLQEWMAGRDK